MMPCLDSARHLNQVSPHLRIVDSGEDWLTLFHYGATMNGKRLTGSVKPSSDGFRSANMEPPEVPDLKNMDMMRLVSKNK